jgi:hypothetical protein
MSVDPPREDGPGEPPEEPLGAAKRALEEHERELYDEMMALAQRGIPPGATVREAMEEMKRALAEDPEVRELRDRVILLLLHGGDGYIRSQMEMLQSGPEEEVETVYEVTEKGALSKEELELMKRLTDELEARIPPGLTEEEREAWGMRLVEEDPELHALATRLQELGEARGGGIWGLSRRSEEEDGE